MIHNSQELSEQTIKRRNTSSDGNNYPRTSSQQNVSKDHTRPRDSKSAKQTGSETKKSRQDDELASIQERIDSSKHSFGPLKTHLDKGTCPKTLRHNVRANITPEQEFKDDIGSIRKKADQALVGALVKFHQMRRKA